MRSLVSILIPAFNAQNWIADTIKSAIGQSLRNWKYAWIKPLFGWDISKRVQLEFPRLKQSLMRFWDGAMYRLEGSEPSTTALAHNQESQLKLGRS